MRLKLIRGFMSKSLRNKIIVLVVLSVAILALDLITKYVICGMFAENEGITAIPYLFNIIVVHNEGAAWGILSGNQIGLIILSVLLFAFLVWYFVKEKKKSWLLVVSMAFIYGGCIGNLFDRIVFGYVRDFIQFAFWQSFPIFNFADVFLTVGVILFAIYLIIFLVKKEKSEDTEVVSAGTGEVTIEKYEDEEKSQKNGEKTDKNAEKSENFDNLDDKNEFKENKNKSKKE